MILSDFEKEIVLSINEQKVNNILTFVQTLTNCKKTEIRTYLYGEDILDVFSTDDRNEIIRRLNTFLRLVDVLANSELISIISDKEQLMILIGRYGGVNNEYVSFDYLDKVLHDNKEMVIIPHEEIKYFIDNDFRTREEIKRDEEKQEQLELQNKSYKLSRNIGIIAIITSVLSAVISMIFNYMTYTNERYVKLTNTEPSKVEIVNPEVKQVLEKNKPDIKSNPENKNNNSSKVQITKK